MWKIYKDPGRKMQTFFLHDNQKTQQQEEEKRAVGQREEGIVSCMNYW